MGSEHALCNTKPECQGDRDIEAPVAGDDGVQPTFIRVLEEHKHTQAAGSGAVWREAYLWGQEQLRSLLKPFW